MDTLERQERVAASQDRIRLKYNLDEMKIHESKWSLCLKDIHDKKLYRHDYGTFEVFLSTELGISRDAGQKRIHAQEMREKLALASPDEESRAAVENLSDAAAIASKLLDNDKRAGVVAELAKKGVVTAAKIQKAAGVEKPKRAKLTTEEKTTAVDISPCPHCGKSPL